MKVAPWPFATGASYCVCTYYANPPRPAPSVLTIIRALYGRAHRNCCNGEIQSVNCHHVAKKQLGKDIAKKIAKIERL